MNALKQQRLHHAYLFSGTRGVGKTSVARLFAKALNCEQGIVAEPCLCCDTCLAIEQACFIDLLEIDGASRTRVEDTRELLDNVQYAPSRGRFKIYLIDEVHMLSQHSFNALLKTLEEPPAHVKFLLATTDPQKLPVTVLSRCLQFHLKPVPPALIQQRLAFVLEKEQHPYEDEALALLANAAQGSLRDGLSLLEQVIAYSDTQLSSSDVKTCLGYTQQDEALALLKALAAQDAQQLLAISRRVAEEGGNFHYVLDELLHALHQISLHQVAPPSALPGAQDLLRLSQQLSCEDVQLFYQMGLKGIEELQLAPNPAMGFEMLLLRMYAFIPASPNSNPPLVHEPTAKSSDDVVVTAPAADPKIEEPPAQSIEASSWGALLPKLQLSGLALSAASHAECEQIAQDAWVLRADKRHESLFTSSVLARIEQALADYHKTMVKLTLRCEEQLSSSPAQQQKESQKKKQEHAKSVVQNDPFFQQLQNEFSAEVLSDSFAAREDD